MKLRTMPLLRALLIVGSLARADPSTGRGPATTDPVLLNRLVVALLDAERYQEALLLAEQALRIRESTLGPNDIHVAESLEGVASALDGLDQYAQAVPLHERAVSILEANLGPRDPIVATALNNLAETFREMGRYERAVPMHERALRIREARLGRNDPDVANSLSNLALTLREMGQYERAAPLYERALRIQEATLGANDPELATTECNLAALFYAMGQLERSIALYSSALRIRETSLGGNHPDVAHSLSGLALPLWRLGQHDRAIPLVERALRIREAALGPHHRDVALSLNNLATLFVETGRFESAIPLLERALRIREAALGPDHPDVAQTLNNLAMALAATGRYQPAIPLLERALRVQEGSLGPTHPDIPDVLNNLAIAFRATGRSERVVALQERALRIDAQRIQGIAAHQRDEGLQQFLAGLRGSADALVSFAAERPGDLSARQLALQGTLLFKARDEEEAIAVLNVLRRSATPADRTLLSEWSSLQQRVANLGSGGTPHGAAGRLESQLQAVEERLSRRSSALQERRGLADIDGLLPRLARHLDADAAMVELVGFRPLDALGHRMSERWGAEHYAAFVLHPDGSHAMVDLGEAGPLNELAQQLTALVSDAHRTPEAIARAGQALEQRLFAPIAPLLRPGTHRLLLAPDGPLHLAPLHLMHDGRRWLLDRYTVSYVTSGRDLLRERSPLDTPGEPV
ncbi:MAG: Tetratricopeptide repeat family protein, partial [Myxococcaceae bacterium]|nr:Tetratricopeptide repeat family protein [Myxococcaceae bacterium]